MDHFPKNSNYLCLKWFLFTVCLILILTDILMFVYSKQIAESGGNDLKDTLQKTIIGESIISMVFTSFGLLGSYRENYCCVVIFAVYMTLCIIAEIYLSLIAYGFWFSTVIYLFITITAYSFARQIRYRLTAIAIQPHTAFMTNYGQTYGFQNNTNNYFRNNPILQCQTLEADGRQLPPYMPSDSVPHEQTLPSYYEISSNPPPYQENDTNPKKIVVNNSDNTD